MTLSLIGAGFGRTGTDSMKLALEQLGLGRCHHMKEVIQDARLMETWRSIAADEITPDWDAVFDGFGATVDWPSAFYWRELAAHYPSAKILLTVRPAEAWYKSFSNTILKVIQESEDQRSLGLALVRDKVFGGRPDDPEHAMATYRQNITEAQAAFGPDRLLTYTVGDGWEPLCAFLGKPVPASAFPRTNSTQEFHEVIPKLKAQAPDSA